MSTGFWIAFIVVVVAGFIVSAFVVIKNAPKLPTYCRVLKRYNANDGDGGEIIELECGHVFRLIHHHRDSFHCEACDRERGGTTA